MRQSSLICVACCMILAAEVFFIIAFIIAVLLYPGGTHFDINTKGCDFRYNFFSDLLRRTALNGEDNSLGSIIFFIGMVTISAGFIPLWTIAPFFFPLRRYISSAVRFFGIISALAMIAVTVTPSDKYGNLHLTIIGFAAVPGILAILFFLAGLFLTKRKTVVMIIVTLVTLLVSSINFIQYTDNAWIGNPCSKNFPFVQKIAAGFIIIWMAFISISTLIYYGKEAKKQNVNRLPGRSRARR